MTGEVRSPIEEFVVYVKAGVDAASLEPKLRPLFKQLVSDKEPVCNKLYEYVKEQLGFFEKRSRDWNLGWNCIYKFPFVDLMTQNSGFLTKNQQYDEFLLLKLHGSVNWFYPGFESHEIEKISVLTSQYAFEEYISGNIETYGQIPFIIPPLIEKQLFYKSRTLKNMWETASEKLRNAEELYFIGFSFPPTDFPIRFLMAETVNEDVPIHVLNYSEDQKGIDLLNENYSSVFPNNRVSIEEYSAPGLKSMDILYQKLKGLGNV